jgi:hypothetical protein
MITVVLTMLVFPQCHAFVYVVNLSQFDQKCEHDDNTNRMVESLALFKDKYERYHRLPWVLVFTHIDLFEKKLAMNKKIGDFFEDYDNSGKDFFKSKFLNLAKSIHDEEIPTFMINSINTEDVRKIWNFFKTMELPNFIPKPNDTFVPTKQSKKSENQMIGDYELIDRLGSGSFGVVYKVQKSGENTMFALKNIVYKNKGQMDMIEQEISILQKVDHPNIIKLHDHFKYESFGSNYIALVVNGYLSNLVTSLVRFIEFTQVKEI